MLRPGSASRAAWELTGGGGQAGGSSQDGSLEPCLLIAPLHFLARDLGALTSLLSLQSSEPGGGRGRWS